VQTVIVPLPIVPDGRRPVVGQTPDESLQPEIRHSLQSCKTGHLLIYDNDSLQSAVNQIAPILGGSTKVVRPMTRKGLTLVFALTTAGFLWISASLAGLHSCSRWSPLACGSNPELNRSVR
jgi:hypothetical protein